jgi:nicotinamidase-related amidase
VPLVNRLLRDPEYLIVGTPDVEIMPELGPEPQDLISQRLHGMSPFFGTSLDPMLRSEGARTVIATGVSLNVGIVGLTIEAINRGYHVVIPGDCVTGFPADYGKLVLERTLGQLATLTSVDAILEAWSG